TDEQVRVLLDPIGHGEEDVCVLLRCRRPPRHRCSSGRDHGGIDVGSGVFGHPAMGVPSAGSTIVVVPDDEPSPAPTNASSMKWVSGGNSAAVTSGLVDASRTIVGSVVTVMVASASPV